MTFEAAPISGNLEIVGRIATASNATFLARIDDIQLVYKPSAGEKPLWDFPDGDLANREVAAYLVSESFGWNIAPQTWLGEGPLGTGMVQRWKEPDPAQDAVDLVPSAEVPDDGWCRVFDGSDERDRPVSLIHEDTVALRRMAVFDIVVNNADRKGAHILEMPDGHRHGVDHGLTFHLDHKLRTVLWGWIGEDLTLDELSGLERVRTALDGDLGAELTDLLSPNEVEMFSWRCDQLILDARFPAPHGDMPAVPWPLI
jgi:uncharacterized repeat protein (TIGR03843 family)